MIEDTQPDYTPTNQTLFAAQEPYLDSGKSALDKGDPHAPVPFFKQKKVIYAVGGIVAVLVVVLVAAVMMNGGTTPMTLVEPSPTPKLQTSGKYAQELKQLNDDLEKADPTQKELPFPPINPEINL